MNQFQGENLMKKLTVFSTLVIIAFALTACGRNEPSHTTHTTPPPPSKERQDRMQPPPPHNPNQVHQDRDRMQR